MKGEKNMLVILFLTLGIMAMLHNRKRKDSILLIIGLLLFIAGTLIEVNAPNEEKMVEQKELIESVVDPDYYILFSEKDSTAICRYKDDNNKGWTEEVLKESYQIIQDSECVNPRIEVWKDKVIGIMRISLSTRETKKLYIPISGICNVK